jgi:hypothetical protein
MDLNWQKVILILGVLLVLATMLVLLAVFGVLTGEPLAVAVTSLLTFVIGWFTKPPSFTSSPAKPEGAP